MGNSQYLEIERLQRRVEELKKENKALKARVPPPAAVESSKQEVRRLRTERTA